MGVDAQAQVRREGLRGPDPRTRRLARSRGWPDVRIPGGRGGATAGQSGVAALTLSRSVTVLGSTGSIGVSTLDLLSHARDGGAEVEIVALTAGKNVSRLAEQPLLWRPQTAVIEDESLLPELRERLAGSGIETAAGKG